MKQVFFLLLTLNLGLGVYTYLRGHAPNPDAKLAGLQMNAEKIRIVPPREKPAPSPASATASSSRAACMEWGSFGGGELARAQIALDRLAPGRRVRRIEVAVAVGYWVYIPPMKSKLEMERKAAELRDLGITDYYPVLDPGRWRHAISLGIFRSEESAKKYLASVREIGVRSANVGARQQRVNQTAFLVFEPTTEDSANLAMLKSEFPGSELRAIECPAQE